MRINSFLFNVEESWKIHISEEEIFEIVWIRKMFVVINYSIFDGITRRILVQFIRTLEEFLINLLLKVEKKSYKRDIRKIFLRKSNERSLTRNTFRSLDKHNYSRLIFLPRYLERSWLCKQTAYTHIASPIRTEKLSTFVGENISVAIISGNSPGWLSLTAAPPNGHRSLFYSVLIWPKVNSSRTLLAAYREYIYIYIWSKGRMRSKDQHKRSNQSSNSPWLRGIPRCSDRFCYRAESMRCGLENNRRIPFRPKKIKGKRREEEGRRISRILYLPSSHGG